MTSTAAHHQCPRTDAEEDGELLALGLDHGARLGVRRHRWAAGGRRLRALRRPNAVVFMLGPELDTRRDVLRMAGMRLTGMVRSRVLGVLRNLRGARCPPAGTGVGSTSRRGRDGRCSSLDMPSGRWGSFRHS
ncbi:MAG: hypothetical protein ACLTSX_06470 [Collinsella sp.]